MSKRTEATTDSEYLAVLAGLQNSRCPTSNDTAADRVSIFDRLDFDVLTERELLDVAAMPIPTGVGRTYWCEQVLPRLVQGLAEQLQRRPKAKAKRTISAGKVSVPRTKKAKR